MDQFDRRLINDIRGDVRHSAQAELLHAEQDDRAIRLAGDEQTGVLDVETAVGRQDINNAGVLEVERGEELEIGVAAAPLHVAMRTVRMQVSTGTQVQVMALVPMIDD